MPAIPKIYSSNFEPYTLWTIENNIQSIQIIPQLGGIINRFCREQSEFINGYTSGVDASRNSLREYKSAKLMPCPNRTKNGHYEFGGNQYQMPCNFGNTPHQIHGFMANKPFQVIGQGGNSQEGSFLTLQYDYTGDHEGFPFPFRIEITYTMHLDNGFTSETFIQNTGNQEMPLGDGWHPYFQINGIEIDQLELQLPNCQKLHVDKEMIPTGRVEAYKDFSSRTRLANTHFDDCFLLEKQEIAKTILYDPAKGLGLEVWQDSSDTQYSYLQLFTPDDRKSIAIEPMSCPPNALNSKIGLNILRPQESWVSKWGATVLSN